MIETRTIEIDEVKQKKDNPRIGNLELLKESLEQNGQYKPIVVNSNNNEILAGNHTWQAAKELGWKEIEASFIKADKEQAARIVLIDNKASDDADYNNELLLKTLKEIDSSQGLKGTGFTDNDISDLLREVGTEAITEGNTDPDYLPDIDDQAPAISQPGDIWQLGDHRLACGSSEDPAVIKGLMNGLKADLIITDPPYGVDYSKKSKEANDAKAPGNNYQVHRDISNDDLQDEALKKFLIRVFSNAMEYMEPGNPVYVFYAFFSTVTFHEALAEVGVWIRQNLNYVKSHFVLGRQDYQWKHEPILYGWKEGGAHKWFGGFDKVTDIEINQLSKLSKKELIEIINQYNEETPTTVFKTEKQLKNKLHPTMKPVELLEQMIQNSSQNKDVILDMFAGSGSIVIAAERTGRRAYCIELDQHYCDTIVNRWEKHTGKIAKLIRGDKEVERPEEEVSHAVVEIDARDEMEDLLKEVREETEKEFKEMGLDDPFV